jgi:hypothetical protein
LVLVDQVVQVYNKYDNEEVGSEEEEEEDRGEVGSAIL